MSKIIKIGTHDSELALVQAKRVQSQLEELGHKTIIVPKNPEGDFVLNKTLDLALLNNEIDIAVHSMEDVPTRLPEGIVQVAVLNRGNVNDTLVFKNNEEFLSQKDAIVATNNSRRRAQWLNRFPTHTIVDIQGNVKERLEQLENNDWNGTIFSAAGIGRLGLRPEDAINLSWMIPAPAQGVIMVTALNDDEFIKEVCTEINHEETEICTTIEREFLNRLEDGCSAPIGALAQIKNEEITFKGVLMSPDGNKKIEVSRVEKVGEHYNMPEFCSNFILERGGKRLMDYIKRESKPINCYSTKTLTDDQLQLFSKDLNIGSSDFIKISLNRMAPSIAKSKIKNVIITNQNAVDSILHNFSDNELQFENIYCVGRRVKRLIEKRIGKVAHFEKNAEKLAEYMVEYMEGTEATYFCSDVRLDNLTTILIENNITVNEIEAYQTKFDAIEVDEKALGIMFYSPSTVQSYMQKNKPNKIAYCMGETTAKEARKHFEDVRVAKIPTVESVIELVNLNYA